MKILFVNKFFYLNGGAETVFFQEREFLLQQGHKVVDFSMADEKNNPSPYAGYFVKGKNFSNGKKIYHKFRQAVSLIHSFEAVKKIEELILREKPQIAHLHNIYHQLTPSIISVLKKHHIKVVLTLHDCNFKIKVRIMPADWPIITGITSGKERERTKKHAEFAWG